ncbi:hypothetical protein T06_11829 [Trichinella sp. T6]|nr:hypothetical protein T06_11829 [Trichinella sp. T6]
MSVKCNHLELVADITGIVLVHLATCYLSASVIWFQVNAIRQLLQFPSDQLIFEAAVLQPQLEDVIRYCGTGEN